MEKFLVCLGLCFACTVAAQNLELHHAVESHVISRVSQLLELGADVNAVDAEGRTPLYLAARNVIDTDIARILLTHHADVSLRRRSDSKYALEGFAPIDIAADTAMSALLEHYGGNLRLAPDHGYHIINRCMHKKDTASLAYFLQHGADITVRDQWNDAPLTFSASDDTTGTLLKFLIDHGLGVNTHNGKGESAAHEAIFDSTGQKIRLLARFGADFNEAQDNWSTLALAYGYTNSHEKPPRRSARFNVILALLDAGADPNRYDRNGSTILFSAVLDGTYKIVQLLLDHHADITSQTRNGESLIFAAAGCRYWPGSDSSNLTEYDGGILSGLTLIKDVSSSSFVCTDSALEHQRNRRNDTARRSMIEYLVGRGAPLTAKTSNGLTPIFAAAWNGFIETCRYLVAHGNNINAHDDRGGTPLNYVRTEWRSETIHDLIGLGADVNARDYQHATPMHHAVCDLDGDLVAALISNGANVNAVDDSNQTPLFWATSLPTTITVKRMEGYSAWDSTRIETEKKNLQKRIAENCRIVTLLLDHGADTTVKDITGKTAADVVEADEVGAMLKNWKR